MKIYMTQNGVDNLFRQCNFSESEKEFVKKYVSSGGKLEELVNYSFLSDLFQENPVGSALIGGATGALTAGMTSDKSKRKKAILKGALFGAGGGLLGDLTTRSMASTFVGNLSGFPNPPAIAGGVLGGYLSSLHEDAY